MLLRNLIGVFSLLSVLFPSTGFAHVSELPPVTPGYKFQEPHKVIELFHRAVERGELYVFDKKMNKASLLPIRVEYVYELNRSIPKIKVYADLASPVPVPGQDGCKVRGVSVVLNAEGSIVESELHVWHQE